MKRPPTGTVTFLFTDIEGSTTLLQRLGDRRYAEVLAEHQRLLRDAFAKGNGQEIDTQGDAFLAAFPRARDAVATAVAAQQVLINHPWPDDASLRVRMGLHTGEPVTGTAGYVGLDVHRAARICSAGHGGQILLSHAVEVLAASDLPAGVSLRDLGAHRLKDLKESERLLQVMHPDLPADFPSLKSLDILPNNLPRQLTSFIGREREIAEIKQLLSTTCLLTLTGAGGSGKTRLAIHVGADLLEQYPGGVWVVELAALTDPALVPQTVAAALRVPEQSGRALIETLVDFLRSKSLLLLFDNCEHLLAACASLADAVLQACPHVRILATSREGLGIAGETLYPVPTLPSPNPERLPPMEDLARYEAVRLFTERAIAVLPTFRVIPQNAKSVVQICHHLDGIPLAIELAAVRVKILAVDQILARLGDRFRLLTGGRRTAPPRHQTLQATMDWSYDLLGEKEQAVLRRLSVFAGGCTLEATEAVCSGDGVETPEVLDLLTQLVDKSLVIANTREGEARYRLLETVRQYAWNRLLESREAANIPRRHRDWYLAFAAQAEPELWGRDQGLWMDRLEADHDNLRAALDWTRTHESGTGAGLRLAVDLSRFWQVRGYSTEGFEWLKGALAHNGGVLSRLRAQALNFAGLLAANLGNFNASAQLCAESLDLFRELGDRRGISGSLINLGEAIKGQGDLRGATALFEEGLVLAREIGSKRGTAVALKNLGWVARIQGDYTRATVLLEEGSALLKEVGDTRGVAQSLMNLGGLAWERGDYGQATSLLEESLRLFRGCGDTLGVAGVLNGLGLVAERRGEYERAIAFSEESLALQRQLGPTPIRSHSLNILGLAALRRGDPERAALLFEQSLASGRGTGDKPSIAEALGNLAFLERSRGEYGRADALYREHLNMQREIGSKVAIAYTLEGLAEVAKSQGQCERATRLFGAAGHLRETIGSSLAPADATDIDHSVTGLRTAMGNVVFGAAWAKGRAMTLEQAIEYALAAEPG